MTQKTPLSRARNYPTPRSIRIGVISDTHGLLRPEAVRALRGVSLIVHAGDVGAPEVLEGLRALAPVTAVRGNNDRGAWARALRETETLELKRTRIHVVHDLKELTIDPPNAGVSVVVVGHSHRPMIIERDGVLFLNPGSAGPRRFTLPVCVGILSIGMGKPRAEVIHLEVSLRKANRRRHR